MTENTWAWTADQLAEWDQRIHEQARAFSLAPYDVDFRILNWEQLADFLAYGMTFHYRHWSFGKQFDLQRNAQRYEMGGLPYEVVVNTNPAVAILWRENNLVLQILVMAHVYGHSDFFAKNVWFQKLTRAERVEDTCQAHAHEISALNSDASIPHERVEELITAAHALMYHRPCSLDNTRETRQEQEARLVRNFRADHQPGEWDHLKPKAERVVTTPNFDQVPLEPDEDILLFLAEYAPLQDWERRILQIVAAESGRLVANIGTKVMNEGWATYWHDRIVKSLTGLPKGFEVEYARSMAGVTPPRPYGINPYWLGLAVWRDIYRRYETPDREDPEERDLPGGQGDEMLFQIRESHCDATFLPSYLTDRLIAELRLVSVLYEGDHVDREVYRITDVPDRVGCQRIRQKIAAVVGLNQRPVVRVIHANYYGDRQLILEHVHDGRDLKLFKPDAPLRELQGHGEPSLSEIEHVLRHIVTIWRNPIQLLTTYDGAKVRVTCDREENVNVQQV